MAVRIKGLGLLLTAVVGAALVACGGVSSPQPSAGVTLVGTAID